MQRKEGNQTMKLSLVVPCYNEEGNVERLFDEIKNVFKNNIDYEIIFVNDGSTDKTADVLKMLYKKENEESIQIVSLSRNFGKEAAMYAGLNVSTGDLVGIIDADLQQHPEIVLKMLKILEENQEIDCVTAYQEKRREGRLMSWVKSWFYRLINGLSDVNFVNGASDFRLMRRTMVNAVISMSEYHRFSKGIFGWVGFNTEYIPYEAQERKTGRTKWNIKKLFKYAIEGIVSFSTAPLRLSTYVGFLSSLISIIYLVVVVMQKLFFGIDVPGYATIVVLVLLLGGLQLFCLGVLGEYLAKMYIQVKNRPVYVIKEHIKKQP